MTPNPSAGDATRPGPLPAGAALAIVESAPGPILLIDGGDRVALVNAAAERAFGYPRAELLGGPFGVLFPDLGRGPSAGPPGGARRVRGRRRDGTEFPAELRLAPLAPGPDGWAVADVRPLDESAAPDEPGRDSRERFRLLVEGVRDYAIYMLDPGGAVLGWNAGAQRLYGYTAEEVVGRHFSAFYPPEATDRRWPDEELRRAAAGGRSEDDGWRVRKDGSRFWANVVVTAIRDAAGRLDGFAKVTRDLTEQTRYEEAIRRQSEMLDLAGDTIIIRDRDDAVTYWNRGAERLYGWTRAEALGRVTHDLLGTAFPLPFEDIRAAVARDGHWAGELVHRRRDGGAITVHSRWTLRRDRDGAPVAVLEINNDITARKAAEQALREKNAELERANRAKDHFLATMSHELRTPLNAVIGFTGTLLMKLPGPLTADQERQLRTVQTSARHLLALINDLLDLARIESGKVELRPEPHDCRAVVREVETALRPAAEARGLRLEVRLPAGEPRVLADRRALSQILLNLVANAIKFTDAGTVALDVVRADRGGRGVTEFRVADTGVGIRPEDQAKLFGAFARVEPAGRHPYEGTGLGLHLSAKLAALLDGRITLASEYGRGSTFTLVLPSAE